ncbi:transporter substrate-binding domain-containing protein, partial [Azospirillum sp. A39]
MKTTLCAAVLAATVAAIPGSALAGQTLDSIKQKGFIQCGVNTGLSGFGNPDSAGKWTGLDVDFCRAAAVALFNDPEKVKFTPLSAQQRFPALQSGEVDI